MKSWIERKTAVARLVRRVSEQYGGDEEEWLRGYIEDVLEGDLEKATECFEGLLLDRSPKDEKVVCVEHPGIKRRSRANIGRWMVGEK